MFYDETDGTGNPSPTDCCEQRKMCRVPWSEELPDRERKRNSFLKKFAIDTKIFILHF